MAKRTKTRAIKHLYKGIFNKNHEVIILRTHAINERHAWINLCHQIAKRDAIHVSHIMGLFDGSKDNYKIELEIEWKEES